MKRLLLLSVFFLTVFISYTVVAQEIGSIRKSIEYSFPEKIQKLVLDPLPAGTYSVGTGGYFATIRSAFDKLSADGVAGNVTLEMIDELYTAPTGQYGFSLNGPIPGAGPNSRITIKPAENKNVIIEGNAEGVLYLLKTSYLTIDGVGISGSTTLTVHNLVTTPYQYNDAITFIGNCDHNVVQNTIALIEDITRVNCGVTFWPETNVIGTPDSNLIQNNFIRKATFGFYVGANTFQTANASGNIIRGNIIGSETDSLITFGIQAERVQNTIIENNVFRNINRQSILFNDPYTYGINIYAGNETVIRNNVLYDINSSAMYGSTGILLSGENWEMGNNNIVYNNMVYDIQCTSPNSISRVSGIQIFNQINPKIYYNSVFLSGTGRNQLGSAAFYIYTGCTNADVKNNIFVNNRDESPYCASAIYDYGSTNLISDYNDLYYETSQYSCLVRIGSTNYNTIEDWQATGKDLNSITEMPNYKVPYLHIDDTIATNLESHATPIAEIPSDIDGEMRNATTPDIGADEFDGFVVPVELTSFTATSNGKEVILNWSTATELNNLGFEVQRSSEGEEFLTVGFVKGCGTSSEQHNYIFSDRDLNNGKYCYRLKQVDFDGSFEYSDVIEVEWRAFNSYLLEQNYPNPFNPTTTIGFGVQQKSNVKITILNAIGEEVAVVLNEEKEAGYHTVEFNAANLPSGVYFYQLKAGSFIDTKKMILLK